MAGLIMHGPVQLPPMLGYKPSPQHAWQHEKAGLRCQRADLIPRIPWYNVPVPVSFYRYRQRLGDLPSAYSKSCCKPNPASCRMRWSIDGTVIPK